MPPLRLVDVAGVTSLVPDHDRILTPAECERIAVEIAARGLWEDVELTPTESHTRAYALLYEDERMEMWLLSWLPHHSTGFHDHGESNVGFCVTQGTIVEQQLRVAGPPSELRLEAGATRAAGSDYIHCLEWESGSPALSRARLLATAHGRRPVPLRRRRRPASRDPGGPRRAHPGLILASHLAAAGAAVRRSAPQTKADAGARAARDRSAPTRR